MNQSRSNNSNLLDKSRDQQYRNHQADPVLTIEKRMQQVPAITPPVTPAAENRHGFVHTLDGTRLTSAYASAENNLNMLDVSGNTTYSTRGYSSSLIPSGTATALASGAVLLNCTRTDRA
ncbi:uncharacterized protein LOC120428842 [Culex pipiens pallens]|uniref:uncharacterized protein LOC120428842 n=1 Tax=Culex pipiens pallens TaxID=42434 RepID=UPI001953D88C|nr:uncharacterized protein LOC120428842 [Culex pipiens pallens]